MKSVWTAKNSSMPFHRHCYHSGMYLVTMVEVYYFKAWPTFLFWHFPYCLNIGSSCIIFAYIQNVKTIILFRVCLLCAGHHVLSIHSFVQGCTLVWILALMWLLCIFFLAYFLELLSARLLLPYSTLFPQPTLTNNYATAAYTTHSWSLWLFKNAFFTLLCCEQKNQLDTGEKYEIIFYSKFWLI